MRRFLAIVSLLFFSIGVDGATVTGNLQLVTGSAAADTKIVFNPVSPPWAISTNTYLGTPATTTSSSGAFSISLVQGLYKVTVGSQNMGNIQVPSGSGTSNINDLWTLITTPASGSGSGTSYTLLAGSGIALTTNATEITISSTASGAGEANTASNLGTGTGVYYSKSGADLRFNSLAAGTGLALSSNANTLTFAATGNLASWSALSTASKSDTNHTHTTSDVTGLTTAINARQLGSANLTNWSALATNVLSDLGGGSGNWTDSGTTNATLAGIASVHGLVATNSITLNGSSVETLINARQVGSANLTNWSALTTNVLGSLSYAATSHNHAASEVTSGTFSTSLLPGGINATNIHDGTIDNTEFSYLDNVTSGIQGQLNSKLDTALGGTINSSVTITNGTLYLYGPLVIDDAGESPTIFPSATITNLTSESITLGGEARTTWPESGTGNWNDSGETNATLAGIAYAHQFVATNAFYLGSDSLADLINARQLGSANLTNWSALSTNLMLTEASAAVLFQATNANLTGWAALPTNLLVTANWVNSGTTNATLPGIGYAHQLVATNALYIGTDSVADLISARQLGSANLTNWSALSTNIVPSNWSNSGTTNATLPGVASIHGLVVTNSITLNGSTMLNRQAAAPVTLTYSTTNVATDASLSCMFRLTCTNTFQLDNPSNGLDGQRVVWELIQDASGSKLIALGSKFALGTDITAVTLTTTANKRDFLTAIYNSTADKWYVSGFLKGY